MTDQPTQHAIVVGVDSSDKAGAAVRWAAQEAALRGCPLQLVHVVAPTVVPAVPSPERGRAFG